MRYQRVRSIAGPKRPLMAAGALLMLSLIPGCGSQYRTVVTPISSTGAASQITSYAIVVAAPCTPASLSSSSSSCPSANTTANRGTVTLLDYSGDTIVDQAFLGPNPVAFTMDGAHTYGHTLNADNTVSTFAPSTSLQTKDVTLSTLNTSTTLGNYLAYSAAAFYLVDASTDQILVMPGAPPAVQQTISVGQGLINFAASPSVQRFYAISQLVPSGSCNTPASVSTAGQVSAVETATNTVSNVIPVGVCPVYGVMSTDGRRAFILNRGSGTVTAIDSQKNILDWPSKSTVDPSVFNNGVITLPILSTNPGNPGPVYAETVPNSNLLVTANYDNNTISVIDITTDVYSNDAATFGKVVATIPVGTHPVSITVLADGSRAYVANQGDGTVSVVNMTTFTVDKTITVNGHPHTVVSAQDSIYGKVYVISPDSKYCTIIRTDQNIVTTSILLPGYGVDVRMSQISSTLSNRILTSRISGSGQP